MAEGGKKKRRKAKKIVGNTARLVGCAGVGLVGLVVDVPAVCGIAVAKSPLFLWKGWKQQVINMEDCVDDGSCSRSMCLPLTGAMIILWPARVVASLASAFVYSLEKGLYGAVVAHRERSIRCGLKHVVAAIAEYDELSNDVIHLRRGTCLPKPAYRSEDEEEDDGRDDRDDRRGAGAVSFHLIRDLDLGKLFEFMSSASGAAAGRRLIQVVVSADRLTVDSAALTILSYLVSDSSGGGGGGVDRVVNDGFVSVSFCDPLETLQRQIMEAVLDASEKVFLEDMVLCRPREVDQALDPIRTAMLQAFGRRIRGMSGFLSMNSEFRRRYDLLVQAARAHDHTPVATVLPATAAATVLPAAAVTTVRPAAAGGVDPLVDMITFD